MFYWQCAVTTGVLITSPALPQCREACRREYRMTPEGGSMMRQVAIAAMDTRVILGALVGWSLLSRVSFGTWHFLCIGQQVRK